jgi:type I restriction enzyme S subunit
MVRSATGASYPAVSDRIVKASTLPLPPLDEQRRIAAILDKADALRQKRKRAIALLDSLTQSIFLEMFGQVHEGKWPLIPLGEAAANEDYRRRPVKGSERRSGPFPYYGASGVVDYVEEPIFSGRRLLVAEDGANLISRSTDIAFIADGEYWVNNHAHVLSDNGVCDLDFLRVFLLAQDLTSFVTGSAQPKLNRSNMDSIPVPLPPRQLQEEFALRLRAASRLQDHQRVAEGAAASLFLTLQHRAFSGQL